MGNLVISVTFFENEMGGIGMRKLIHALFFVAGICVSALGLDSSAGATVIPVHVNAVMSTQLKPTVHGEKLYFNDVIQSIDDSQLLGAHYSHQSHVSHASHRSHYSHVSSRY